MSEWKTTADEGRAVREQNHGIKRWFWNIVGRRHSLSLKRIMSPHHVDDLGGPDEGHPPLVAGVAGARPLHQLRLRLRDEARLHHVLHRGEPLAHAQAK